MKPKEYLKQIEWLDRQINHRVEELEEYKSKVYLVSSVSYDKDSIQTSKSNDRMLDAVGRIMQLEHEIDKLIDEYVDKKNLIIKQIEALDNKTYSELLYNRYVRYMRLSDIACTMHYSFDWARKFHGIALKTFGDTYLTNKNT